MNADRERLIALVNGFRATQVIHVMAVLGVADRLAHGPATAAELAEAAGVDGESLRRVLRIAAYLGLLAEEPEQRFALTSVGEGLRSDVPGSMHPGAVMLGTEHYRAWGELLHSVRTGEPAFPLVFGSSMFEYLAAHPAAQAVFDAGMTGNVEQQLGRLAHAYDFSEAEVVVDVGGGSGAVAATILKANPRITVVLQDQAQVLTAAREFLGVRGVLDRCRLEPGDFFESVPEGGDVYVLSHIVHDWPDELALRILRNCRRAMKPSSTLLLLEAVLPPHGTTAPASLFDVNMLVMLGGRERTEEEFRSMLEAAGLRLSRVTPVSDRRSIVEALPA